MFFLQSLPISKLSLSSTSSPAFVYMRTFDYVVRVTDVLTITKLYKSTTGANELGGMPVVFIHSPYSNPHSPQMGRVLVENNYPLNKRGG
jgi:hypothetical protein